MKSQKKTKKSFLGLVARGLGMGAADVVPGVSGGTIAFITGIYEEFLETVSSLNFGLIKTWRKEGFKAMWTAMNGSFLIAIFLGIGISIVSLAKLLTHLLETQPTLLWSFFFGLIIASVWLVGKTVEKWTFQNISALIIGTALAYTITLLSPGGGSESYLYIFLCGTLAICAMILPGISGSFILLLLGAYTTILGSLTGVIDSLKAKDWDAFFSYGIIIAIFMAGCLVGLIAFSKLLNWLFKKSKNLIISILTGFLIGSLNKIWPWKMTTVWTIDRHGETVPAVQENISPSAFAKLFGDSQLILAILLMLAGLALIIALEYFGNRLKTQRKTES
ncbi:MAG: putative membrane protein [Arenicella sp.]|jgi:putative membrane protein